MQVRVARFHFNIGEPAAGLQLMSRALSGNPGFRTMIFQNYREYGVAAEQVVREGLPDQATGAAYLTSLIEKGDLLTAATAWQALLSKSWLDHKTAAFYTNTLYSARDFEGSARSWAEFVGPASGFMQSTQLFNGDFEQDLTASPFDWYLVKRAGVEVSIDPNVAYSGKRSARLRFDGTANVELSGLSQTSFVPPGRYLLEAYIKTDGLTTNQGVAFRIASRGLDVTTPSMIGTSNWTAVRQEFDVPPNPDLVEVSVVRKASLKFDNKIKGTAWIDQVRITKVGPATS